MFGNDSLMDMYNMNFVLMHRHGFNLETIENMYPYEREIYVGLIEQRMEQQRLMKMQQQSNS